MRRALRAIVLMAGLCGMLAAHGNEKQLMGTVLRITDTDITVVTKKKEMRTVKFTAETKFIRDGGAASRKDVSLGDRVVIRAKEAGNALEAEEVRLAKAKETPKKK